LSKILEKKLFKDSKGAILIEFAFAIPVLVIVLYFVLDVPQAYIVSLKLQKTSELYGQILMNLTKKRNSRLITIQDLKYVSKSVGLVFTGVVENPRFPFFLSTYVSYVEGTDGTPSIKWTVHIQNNLATGEVFQDGDMSLCSDYFSESFIKDLNIKKGEKKLIIETAAWYKSGNSRGFNNMFYLLTIPGKTKNGAKVLGDKVGVITPEEGQVTNKTPT
jgi:hypothetical protein